MFLYPPSTHFGKAVPKTRIHAAASSSKRVKELFTAQLSAIVWKHKLSPETLRLPARHGITEIQVFSLHLKSADLDPAILRAIDKAIPFPVLFEILHADRIRFAASYKRPSEADAAKWVVEGNFYTDWFHHSSFNLHPLPVSLDLASLHDQLIRQHIPLPPRPGETLREHVARVLAIESKQREAAQLETKLQREKQFNRKVELNQQLRAVTEELRHLSSTRDDCSGALRASTPEERRNDASHALRRSQTAATANPSTRDDCSGALRASMPEERRNDASHGLRRSQTAATANPSTRDDCSGALRASMPEERRNDASHALRRSQTAATGTSSIQHS